MLTALAFMDLGYSYNTYELLTTYERNMVIQA